MPSGSHPGEGAASAPVWQELAWSGVPQWGSLTKAFHFHLSFESWQTPAPPRIISLPQFLERGKETRGWGQLSFPAPTSGDSPWRLGLCGVGGRDGAIRLPLLHSLAPPSPPHKPHTRPPHTLHSPRPSSPDLSQPGRGTQRCCRQHRSQVRLHRGLQC